MKIDVLKQRYKILNMISASSTVRVYICLDQVLGLTRIIKESRKKVEQEFGDFDTLKNLHHIGLPQIYDVFEDNINNYIVLEHIDGHNLKSSVDEKGKYSFDDAIIIIRQLLLVVRYLHTIRPKAIIHGDIKPENIIVDKERTVLIDFDSVNNQKGTSYFIAPERLLGMKKSQQSDIYSIGLVIHFMMTGKIKKVYHDEDDLRLNEEIKIIIDKCTKKNPNERYKNVGFIISDLEKIKMHKTVEVRNRTKVISVHGCSHLANELSYVISKNFKKKTLLIDTNIFDSEIGIYIPKNQCKLYLQDYVHEESDNLYRVNHKSNLYILPCRADLESYENFSVTLLEQIMSGLGNQFEIIIINSTDFIYDALCIKSVYLSDTVIYSVKNGISDIRKYNAIINFLSSRQNISKERFVFVQFNIFAENIRKSLSSKAVEATWLCEIPYSKKRAALTAIAGNYAVKMENNIRRRYIRLIKMLNI
ncbi:MAG: protein kinase [Clostridia bacterium]|nr:protein kinase [Clostridia bacterium]